MMPGRTIAGQWGAAPRLRALALAGVIVVAVAAGLAALGARFVASPATPEPALVDWRADDGTTFRLALDAARYDRFLEQRAMALAQERQRLSAIAGSTVEREVADVYGRMTTRVPVYTDWVYGWIQNYITTYLVIGRTLRLTVDPPDGTERRSPFTAFSEGMHEVIASHFTSIVVEPASPQTAMANALIRVDTLLAAEWRQVLAVDRAAWDGFLSREGHAVPARGAPPGRAGDARCDMPGLTPQAAPQTLAQVDRIDGQQTDLFALRLARPPTFFVFRLGIAPILTTGSLVSVTALANPASAVALGVTSAGLWTLDFVINEIDGMLNRGAFEVRLVSAIEALRRSDTQSLSSSIDDAIAAAFTTLAACRDPVATALR